MVRRIPQPPTRRIRADSWLTPTNRDGIRTPNDRLDRRPRESLSERLPAPHIEGASSRGDYARLFYDCLRGFDRSSGPNARCESVSRMGVPAALRVRRVQDRRVWDLDHAGRSVVHVSTLFEVRPHRTGEPSQTGTVLLLEVWLRGSRGLQRGEEHRNQTRPRGAEVSARTGQPSTGPKVGNVERERRVYVRRHFGLSGSSPTNPGVYARVVDTLSSRMKPPNHFIVLCRFFSI